MSPSGYFLSPRSRRDDVRPAVGRDIRFILDLTRKYTDALGFIPLEGVERYISQKSVILALENDDPAGFILTKPELSTCPAIRPILQAAVCYDAQRRKLGLRLVDNVVGAAVTAGSKVLRLWCRSELDANEFWAAAGFHLVGHRDAGGRRGGSVNLWARQVGEISPADLLLARPERHRGPGGFFSSKPLLIHPASPPVPSRS